VRRAAEEVDAEEKDIEVMAVLADAVAKITY
jgi:hypothetical protein